MNNPMLQVNGVSKSYGKVAAVVQASFDVQQGELFGLIGPDGAGKSTLFRMIISLLVPDQGFIRLNGLNPVADYAAIRKLVGYMPGKFSLYEDLSVEENLQFFASVFDADMQENYHLIEPIYKQIAPFRNRPAGKLSGGMKQKLALCCALIHQPLLLVLDEPTTGVDAVSRQEFWEMLEHLKQIGMTILVSTPYADEVIRCDRVAMMHRGAILRVDTVEGIVSRFPKPLVAVSGGDAYGVLLACRQFWGCHTAYPFGGSVHVALNHSKPEELRLFLLSKGFGGIRVALEPPGIEDCFLALQMNESQLV